MIVLSIYGLRNSLEKPHLIICVQTWTRAVAFSVLRCPDPPLCSFQVECHGDLSSSRTRSWNRVQGPEGDSRPFQGCLWGQTLFRITLTHYLPFSFSIFSWMYDGFFQRLPDMWWCHHSDRQWNLWLWNLVLKSLSVSFLKQ